MTNMKKVVLSLVIAALPAISLAEEQKPAAAPAAPAPVSAQPAAKAETPKGHKVAKASEMKLTLSGVSKENRVGIEQLAKDAGASHASLNVKSGQLKVQYTKEFNKDQFTSSLTSKYPGVSIK